MLRRLQANRTFRVRYSLLTMQKTKGRRMAEAEALIKEITSEWLSDDEAIELFEKLGTRPKGKRRNPERDWVILNAHDTASKASIANTASQLFREHGTKVGNSAEAVERHLRRLLLKERIAHRDRIATLERWLRGKPPKTFLGNV